MSLLVMKICEGSDRARGRRRLGQYLAARETGWGKKWWRAIHQLSKRHAGPFVAVNCATVPETLAEAEFFGNLSRLSRGLLLLGCFRPPLADRCFLDEIGDMSVSLQPRLFRATSEKEIAARMRRASSYRLSIDRPTNQPLWNDGSSSNFRKDFWSHRTVPDSHSRPSGIDEEDIVPLLLPLLS